MNTLKESPNSNIDPYLFERHFQAFQEFVEQQVQLPFTSFASHPYTEEQESYKYDVHKEAREALGLQTWKKTDIGTGRIAAATLAAIEIPNSNLVPWQPRFGHKARPHQPLYEARKNSKEMANIEKRLFKLFRTADDAASFDDLVEVFGRTYPLLAYLFFVKDRSKYLPIAPVSFDKAFKKLGADFVTSHHCSWDNYSTFVRLIGELRSMLADALTGEVTLLDAHSFAWIVARQMEEAGRAPDLKEYESLSKTEREAIVKARIGQGQFRDRLINYWKACAVTGCKDARLLRASHIKPWAKSALSERLSLYNGLLLSPSIDACFDGGFISFNGKGKIMISKRLATADRLALGITDDMKLSKLEPNHSTFLAYHRKHIYLET